MKETRGSASRKVSKPSSRSEIGGEGEEGEGGREETMAADDPRMALFLDRGCTAGRGIKVRAWPRSLSLPVCTRLRPREEMIGMP